MTFRKLILRNLWHFRKQHLAVFAGTLISTAVLTGALIVGDSVKYSLRHLVDIRLGNVRFALQTGDRFVRADLAGRLENKIASPAAPVLMMDGLAKNPANGTSVSQIQVLGVEPDFWEFFHQKIPALNNDEAIVSESVAAKLDVKSGEELLLRINNPGIIPLNAPFAEDNNTTRAFRVKVVNIAGDEMMGRFSLKNSQAVPYNVFVSRNWLGEKLELAGLANLVILAEDDASPLSAVRLNQHLSEIWTASDAGLKIRTLEEPGKYELLSHRIFIDEPVSKAIQQLKTENQPVMTYLVNSLCFREKETPYSFVSAVPESLLQASLKNDEIVINQWLAEDLGAERGDTLTLKYFVIGPLRKLDEKSRSFRVSGIMPLVENNDAKNLMPDFPGLADAGSCHDWETGVPIDLKKIRKKDEDYWDKYKGTPKAFISLYTGTGLWANDFGSYTAFRFDEKEIKAENLLGGIMQNLQPEDVGFQFLPVYEQGLSAVENSVNFGELFISLSFFVIAAGVLLTALLYALLTVSRQQEAGIFSSLGFDKKTIISFRLAESALTAISGGIAGAFAGILYNQVMIAALNSVWQGAVQTSGLTVYTDPLTVLAGALSGIVIAFAVIFFITRNKLKQPVSILVKKGPAEPEKLLKKSSILNWVLIIAGFAGAAALVVYSLGTSVDANSGLFLSAGGLFLVGSLASLHLFLHFFGKKPTHDTLNIVGLAVKNAGRNKPRSLATIALLALGVFTIIITGANRKTFYGTENQHSSGTGGFPFWVETTLPILHNLNTPTGKEKYNLADEPAAGVAEFVQLHTLDGDDASCLNLNQVSQPQILGVPSAVFDQRKSFSFTGLLNRSSTHPWLELKKDYGKNVIPAIADQTVITWGLMKKLGDTLFYLNEKGDAIKLLLVAGLQSSIFQGNVLISDSAFTANFPSVSGSKTMLVDVPARNEEELASLLETSLAIQGVTITKAPERLAAFNTVTNTYLSVFMALGGLGVLIGTLGLGIVLLRNIMERRHEFALLLALGISRKKVFRLVMSENLLLLTIGLVVGVTSAIIGILPSVLSTSFSVSIPSIVIIISAIVISGTASVYSATSTSLKSKLTDSLNVEKL